MAPLRLIGLTTLAMLAFAANSLLCRMALQDSANDAMAFTAVRLSAGALTLWIVSRSLRKNEKGAGNWISALALFVYAVGFSLAYVSLPTATGAVLLFGAVQASMIGYGLWSGERLAPLQCMGVATSLAGLIYLLWPGLSAPPISGALLMLAAGGGWGVYSLRGRSGGDPTWATAGNFLRAAPLALIVTAIVWMLRSREEALLSGAGLTYAALSGALASGIGYALWYAALPNLRATTAATVQLSVPVIASAGGILLLGESLNARFLIASLAILGGIFVFVRKKAR